MKLSMISHTTIACCVYQAESLAVNWDNEIVLGLLDKKGYVSYFHK